MRCQGEVRQGEGGQAWDGGIPTQAQDDILDVRHQQVHGVTVYILRGV